MRRPIEGGSYRKKKVISVRSGARPATGEPRKFITTASLIAPGSSAGDDHFRNYKQLWRTCPPRHGQGEDSPAVRGIRQAADARIRAKDGKRKDSSSEEALLPTSWLVPICQTEVSYAKGCGPGLQKKRGIFSQCSWGPHPRFTESIMSVQNAPRRKGQEADIRHGSRHEEKVLRAGETASRILHLLYSQGKGSEMSTS